MLDVLRRTFELHGFAGIETRAVEPVEDLLRKGETSKEVYAVSRLHDDGGEHERRLGLHFDLTVPLARYVLEHAGKLVFPFKRYQIQKVWRGERPQEGRFREFTQADIDVIGAETLPFHYEVDLPLVMAEALSALPIPPVRMAVNNRKIAEGFYTGIGLTEVDAVLRAIDKLAKIGPEAVAELRRLLLDHPTIWEELGGVSRRVAVPLARVLYPNELAGRESLLLGMDRVREELGYLAAPPLLRLLIDDVAITRADLADRADPRRYPRLRQADG